MAPNMMRVLKYALKLLVPTFLVILIVNVMFMNGLIGHKLGSTTVIVQEVHNRISDNDASSSDNSSYGIHKRENLLNREIMDKDDKQRQAGEKQNSENVNSAPKVSKDLKSKMKDTPLKDDAVDAMIDKLRKTHFFPKNFWNVSLADLAKSLGALAKKTGKTLSGYKDMHRYIYVHVLFSIPLNTDFTDKILTTSFHHRWSV